MERQRKVKALSVVALVVAVLGLTVAFAALSTTLTINGQAKVTAGTWDVHFEGESADNGTITAATQGSASGESATIETTKISGIDVTMKKPGDYVTYTFYVVNNGDIDAKISAISKQGPTCTPDTLPLGGTEEENSVCGNLDYKLEYDGNAESLNGGDVSSVTDEGELKLENKLPKKTKRKVKLTIGYKMSATKIPDSQVTVKIPDITITYGQD